MTICANPPCRTEIDPGSPTVCTDPRGAEYCSKTCRAAWRGGRPTRTPGELTRRITIGLSSAGLEALVLYAGECKTSIADAGATIIEKELLQ